MAKKLDGNQAIITDLTNHLYKQFIDYVANNPVSWIDGMLAAHNFHVSVIEYLVNVTGDTDWRQGAKESFANRMDNPIQADWDSESGYDDA